MTSNPLPFLSHHESGKDTIVLLHGAFSSCHAFDAALPGLHRWHALIPDHTDYTMRREFSVIGLIDDIAELIYDRAHNSRAHVVGFSFGGHLALRLAARHPHLVTSVFVSGVNRVKSSGGSILLPHLVLLTQLVGILIPGSLKTSWMDGSSSIVEGTKTGSLTQARNILNAIQSNEKFQVIKVRVLIVAAIKNGVLLDPDSTQDASEIFSEIKGASGSCIVAHRGLTHSWIDQDPFLFVSTVTAWAECRSIDEKFEAFEEVSGVSSGKNGFINLCVSHDSGTAASKAYEGAEQ
ncbi:alpha/beta-hydrolase [Glonium stellatum]|uniref:Alpha/beta-hydrolase n=1 Tax=Glonium stellatum TaxID=574774 RepID=A0A8E2F8V1_9PEZI|nr:alpha/beta-hydrolase [Glonium stellatum]